MTEKEIGGIVLGCAMRVHTALGPGLLESAYEGCLAYEPGKAGVKAERQSALPLIYDEVRLDAGYRLDLPVEDIVLVEVKAIETLLPVLTARPLTCFKLSPKKSGYLLNV